MVKFNKNRNGIISIFLDILIFLSVQYTYPLDVDVDVMVA